LILPVIFTYFVIFST